MWVPPEVLENGILMGLPNHTVSINLQRQNSFILNENSMYVLGWNYTTEWTNS